MSFEVCLEEWITDHCCKVHAHAVVDRNASFKVGWRGRAPAFLVDAEGLGEAGVLHEYSMPEGVVVLENQSSSPLLAVSLSSWWLLDSRTVPASEVRGLPSWEWFLAKSPCSAVVMGMLGSLSISMREIWPVETVEAPSAQPTNSIALRNSTTSGLVHV